MNRILITGGAGFIGSRLSIRLINKGYTVTVLDNLSEQIHGEDPETTSELFQSIRDKVTFINGSVVDKDCLRKAIEGQDAIVHLAAETGTGQSMYAIDKYVEVNIGGTAKLLDILTNQEHQVKKVVVASSRAIYGEGKYVDSDGKVYYPSQRNQEDMDTGYFELKAGKNALFPVATDEESRIHPSSLYGISKYNQEQMIMTLCPAIGVHPVALRYQNVYGPGQSLRNPYTGILSIFSTKIRNGNDIVIFEDGKESRDFVYIDDIVSATVSALEMDEANGQVYNVGTGVPTDVITVAEELIRNLNGQTEMKISGKYRVGDIRHNFADISKIQGELGFKPTVDFAEGIRRFCEWVDSQEVVADQFDRSMEELKSRGLYK